MRRTARSQKAHNKILAYGALTVVTLLWALAGPVIKLTLTEIPPMHFLFFRFLLVCVIVLPATLLHLQQHPLNRKEIPIIVALGLLGQTSLAFTFAGFQYATALDASIISLISPVLAVAAGHYYFNEKIGVKTKIGVALATVGTLLIVIEPLFINGGETIPRGLRILGNVFILIATLAFLIYILWSKYALGQYSKRIHNIFDLFNLNKLKKGRSPLFLTFLTFYIGLATMVPLVLLENFRLSGSESFALANLSQVGFLGIIYMAVFSSVVAYTLFQWALTISSVADTAFFNYLSPVFTLPFAYLLLGELPNEVTLIGAGVIAVGVIIAEHKKS